MTVRYPIDYVFIYLCHPYPIPPLAEDEGVYLFILDYLT